MIFVDSNIPMYLAGRQGAEKDAVHSLLQRWIAQDERLVTSAEALQEILHRHSAIGRKDAIAPAFETLLGIVDEIFAIEARDAQRAKEILLGTQSLSARDAVHIAVMERRGVTRIASFDRGFDGYPGVTRIFS
jgi:predicted nucleic acid-binding protein